MPRHSGRIRRPLDRYEANMVVYDKIDEVPSTYEDGMIDTHKEKWCKAINQEIESMYFNSVWELIDFPEGFRLIGNNLILQEEKGT